MIEPNDTATKNDLIQLDRKFELHWHSLQRKVDLIEKNLEHTEKRIGSKVELVDKKVESLRDLFFSHSSYVVICLLCLIFGLAILIFLSVKAP